MRATVLTDRSLAKHAGRFVWLSIDTENEKNAAFLDKYPWEAVPTFEVVNPATEAVAYRWVGAVDAPELVRRFGEAEKAIQNPAAATGAAEPTTPDAGLVALSMAGKHEECATSALTLLTSLPDGAVKGNVAAVGLDCALSAPEDATWRAAALARLEPAALEAVRYPGMLDDDRSGLYGILVDARDRQHDEPGKKATAIRWLDWLDEQANAAPTEARAALDGYRVQAALSAGRPQRVLAPIERSERELPADYNPPARLATILRELGRYDDALAASDRALSKVYGPRKLTVLDGRATILEKKGDAEAAKAVLRQALEYAQTLPPIQRPKGMIARIEKRLAM